MNTEENPCNFCGTPNSEYPNKKCARTPICTNKINEKYVQKIVDKLNLDIKQTTGYGTMNDTEKELLKFEKKLTLNDTSESCIHKCTMLLLNFMNETNKVNNLYTEYFHLNLTDSEKSPFAKDLILRWAARANKGKKDD